MAKFNIRSTLVNRDAVISTVWSLIQQLVVASSTYFILQGIQHITAGDMSAGLRYLGAFVGSLVLVYLPNTLSTVYMQKWRLSSIDSFIKAFERENFGRTTLGHARNKVHAESSITNECFTVYDQATNLLYQIISTFLNSALNILVIAAMLDARILLWYLLAGGILVASHFFFDGVLASASFGVQKSRKDLSSAMLTAWENIFVGNRQNFLNWRSGYESALSDSRVAATRYDVVRSLVSSGAVAVALLIVALGNGIFLRENVSDLSAVAALVVTLPRQLQIIQSIFAFFNLALSWSGTKAQLAELQTTVEFGRDAKPSLGFVDFEALELSGGRAVGDFAQMRKTLGDSGSGRFTLRGRNGAGKSTLLSLIKEDFGDRAFLLPTNYSDLVFKSSFLTHSDGNRLLSVFEDIKALENVDVVILDEWDANLDARNISLVSEAIGRLSLEKVVIESRHRA